MMNLELIPKFQNDIHEKCQTCVEAKKPRKPFKSVQHRETELLELIHTDICEINGELTKGGKRYFVTFIDDFSRYCHVHLMKHKDEVMEKFLIYKAMTERQTGKLIMKVRSDRRGEYTSTEIKKYYEEFGIIHQLTSPYSPQSNGIAERKIKL